MDEEMGWLSLDDAFTFTCSRQLSCFNACCRDLNQFLTPYDIIRLKKNLRLTSADFLKRYTQVHEGPQTGLPVVSLRPDYTSGLTCPFLYSDGCGVYEDRPSSCRMYPLARMASRSRETGQITERYVMLKEAHCLGHQEGKSRTIREWIADQGIAGYNRMNDLFMELISLKNRLIPGPLDLKSGYLFCLVCYDLDTFRHTVFDKDPGKECPDREAHDRNTADDESLLLFGMNWLKKTIFREGEDAA